MYRWHEGTHVNAVAGHELTVYKWIVRKSCLKLIVACRVLCLKFKLLEKSSPKPKEAHKAAASKSI